MALSLFGFALRHFRNRRAGIALIFALTAPLLIAATGLTVDAGYWYQQQESIQSAADAAALSAAQGALKASITTSSDATSYAANNGATIAQAAANNATNQQFKLGSSSTRAVALTGSYSKSGSTITTTWVATVTIPRASFFSAVRGLGLSGLGSGLQSASATAVTVSTDGTYCAHFSGTVTVTGGAKVYATNCGIYSGSTACASGAAAITVTGSGQVIGTTGVATASSCVSDDGYTTTPKYSQSGYIGTNASNSNNGDISTVSLNTADPGDALSGMNSLNTELWNPGWTVPSAPSQSGSAVNVSKQISQSWNPLNTNSVQCDYGSIPAGSCVVDANADSGYLTGLNGYGLNGLTLTANTTGTPGTYITGGFSGQNNNGGILKLQDSSYYISGGMKLALSNGLSIGNGSQSESFVVNGGTSFTNSTVTLPTGTYYLSGSGATLASTSNATKGNYALTTNSPTVVINGSQYYVNGGVDLSGGTTSSYLTSGLYEFKAYTNGSNTSSGKGAFYAEEGYDTFGNATTLASSSSTGSCSSTISPATYYFDGGLTISGGTSNVLLCPGIYYVRNGNLVIESSSHVTGIGVTFVLEGTAGYIFNGGAAINLTAPTTNCVSTSDYPLSAYENPTSPYDGTNGQGICGIAIYQSRTDTTGDTVNEGASTTINGAIYTPGAALTISGAGALTITTSGVPSLTAASLNDSGSGNITITENSAGSSSSTSSTSSGVLLVN
ncbi:MAG: pilus assembly protein TadG-related protein [Acidocella sp.]|nr:pilus assembly protein TadG-related protein [Acidocella sp.]